MTKKQNKSGVNPEILHIQVPDLGAVNAKRLKKIKWPQQVKTVCFMPRKPVEKLYEVLLRNIPDKYKVKLTYLAKKGDIKIPADSAGGAAIKVKAFNTRAEMLSEFKRGFRADYLKYFYAKEKWRAETETSLKYFNSTPLANAFRAVKRDSCAGLLLLLDWKYSNRPASLVGWIWISKTLTTLERRQVRRLMLIWLKKRMRPIAVAGVDGFNPASQGVFKKSGFTMCRMCLSKDRNYLGVSPGQMPYLQWYDTYYAAWGAVEDADYGRAMAVLTPAHKKYPGDFRVARTYAMCLGDYADTLSGARQKALKKQSCAMLGKLVKKMRTMKWEVNVSTRNEYYYHTGQFNKQYALGVEAAAGGSPWGNYGAGVGAANYAYEHAAKGHARLAAMWARRCVTAYEAFFKYKDGYYNAYVHYALALGILGRNKEMEAALKKSAALSGKPRSYREFAEVREKISRLTYGR